MRLNCRAPRRPLHRKSDKDALGITSGVRDVVWSGGQTSRSSLPLGLTRYWMLDRVSYLVQKPALLIRLA